MRTICLAVVIALATAPCVGCHHNRSPRGQLELQSGAERKHELHTGKTRELKASGDVMHESEPSGPSLGRDYTRKITESAFEQKRQKMNLELLHQEIELLKKLLANMDAKGSEPAEVDPDVVEHATEEVSRALEEVTADLRTCAGKTLKKNKKLSGRVEVELQVVEDGRVDEAEIASSELPWRVKRCIRKRLEQLIFPPLVGGEGTLSWTFELRAP